jgi:hypothetical protein
MNRKLFSHLNTLPDKSQCLIHKCFFFLTEKGFINATNSSEAYEIDQYEEFCFSVRFKAYPQIQCTWTFSRKSFPCEQSGLEDGYR